MSKRWVCIFLIVSLMMTYGCAVATTANVNMPDAFATPAPMALLSAEASSEPVMVDIAPTNLAVASARESVPPAMGQAPILSDAQPYLTEAVLVPAEAALIAPLSGTDAPATPELTPELTPEPTPEPTPKPTQKPTPEPTPAFTVKPMEAAKGYVYAKTVNLRSGPGTEYEALGEYAQHTPLTVTGVSGDWYLVEIGGMPGFMLEEFVKQGDVPTPEPTASPKPKATATPKPTPEPTLVFVPEASAPPVNAAAPSDDLYLVAQLVDEEAPPEGFVAVANVIYNRVHSSKFPNSIQGVVFQANQFTPARDEARLRAVTPSAAAIAAVDQIFVQHNLILPADVLYFRAAGKGTAWGKRVYFGTFGGNDFFM